MMLFGDMWCSVFDVVVMNSRLWCDSIMFFGVLVVLVV